MTVKELIALLKKRDPDTLVVKFNDQTEYGYDEVLFMDRVTLIRNRSKTDASDFIAAESKPRTRAKLVNAVIFY